MLDNVAMSYRLDFRTKFILGPSVVQGQCDVGKVMGNKEKAKRTRRDTHLDVEVDLLLLQDEETPLDKTQDDEIREILLSAKT